MNSRPGARQVGPLVSLRWQMVRSRRARAGLLVAVALLPALAVLAVVVGRLAPSGEEVEVAILAPSVLLAFLGLAILAPLAAGGGTELYPPDQLVAYPIRPRTVFRGALLLAPLNLAWVLQVLAALGLTTYVVGGSAPAIGAALVTMLVYLAVVTVAGQGIAWTVIGLRQSRRGRLACWVVLGVLGALVVGLLAFGLLTAALDSAPTRWVFLSALDPSAGNWSAWVVDTSLLAVSGLVVLSLSERACRWSLGRAADATTSSDGDVVRRRPLPGSEHHALVLLTRRGLWRSRPVRRGALLLVLLPGTMLAAAGVGWDSLLLLPGLIAAGSAMLFGINAFCLDASGATWIATLPHRPGVTYWARTRVVIEVNAAIVVIAVGAGALRAPSPTAAELVAFVAAVVVAVLRASATCMHLSVTRPHRADLVGPRDAPAPPGAMALYSMRLAVTAAFVGLSFGLAAEVGSVTVALALGVAYGAFAVRSLMRTGRKWANPLVRARVVATVSTG